MLKVGETVEGPADTYEIERVRGEGGFGVAYVGVRQGDGASVIVKELRMDRLDDWKALELFEREATVLQGLKHPHIPAYGEFFAHGAGGAVATVATELGPPPGTSMVLVQDFIDGDNLQEAKQAGRRLTPADLERLLREMLDVLHYLHGLSPPVIHRDINPRNIVWSKRGGFYLVDFGAIQATLLEGTGLGSTSVGSFGYFPMEQSLGKARPASDLYALGMTMLTVISGNDPSHFPMDESTGKVRVETLAAAASDPMRAALGRMVEPIVGQRVQHAQDVLDVLNGHALVPRVTSTALVTKPPWLSTLYSASLGLGGIAAALIYTVFFDGLSETSLVAISALWGLPVVFGLAGHLTKSFGTAVALTGAGGLALVVFLFAIFPGL